MLCRKNSSFDDRGSVPVYLNVYDLTPFNGYAYWLGLGVYHSGVQGWFFFFGRAISIRYLVKFLSGFVLDLIMSLLDRLLLFMVKF